MPVDERLKQGLALFNQKEFFECHEVIEELWLETPKSDPLRDFYKGVIQAAAALYQAERGIHSGAEGLYHTSLKYLVRYRPVEQGLNVSRLTEDLKKYFDDFLADGPKKSVAPPPQVEYNFRDSI